MPTTARAGSRRSAPTGGGYAVADFADNAATSGVVDMAAGPDGDIHWVSINDGTVYRLRFTGQPPPVPPEPVTLDFSEGQGTTAFDSSGNSNDAELRGGATWGPGKIGGGLALDGAGDLASIADAPSLAFRDELTVAGWVRRTSAPAGWHQLVSRQHTTTSADQFLLGFKGATPNFGVRTPNGHTNAGSGSVPLGQWVHLAGTYNGARIILYVNGVERARVAKTGPLVASSAPGARWGQRQRIRPARRQRVPRRRARRGPPVQPGAQPERGRGAGEAARGGDRDAGRLGPSSRSARR